MDFNILFPFLEGLETVTTTSLWLSFIFWNSLTVKIPFLWSLRKAYSSPKVRLLFNKLEKSGQKIYGNNSAIALFFSNYKRDLELKIWGVD